jgi:hypothetical protein
MNIKRFAFVTDMNTVRFELQSEICNLKSEMNMPLLKLATDDCSSNHAEA